MMGKNLHGSDGLEGIIEEVYMKKDIHQNFRFFLTT
jgi:hypothetical protein